MCFQQLSLYIPVNSILPLVFPFSDSNINGNVMSNSLIKSSGTLPLSQPTLLLFLFALMLALCKIAIFHICKSISIAQQPTTNVLQLLAWLRLNFFCKRTHLGVVNVIKSSCSQEPAKITAVGSTLQLHQNFLVYFLPSLQVQFTSSLHMLKRYLKLLRALKGYYTSYKYKLVPIPKNILGINNILSPSFGYIKRDSIFFQKKISAYKKYVTCISAHI